jgi:hypothetical protein
MTTLANLGAHADGVLIAQSQSQKEVTSNALDTLLSNATQKPLAVAIPAAAGSPLSADRTLTADEFFGHVLYQLSGTPGQPFNLRLPMIGNHVFVVQNDTAETATVVSGGGSTVDVAAGKRRWLHSNGSGVIALAPVHDTSGSGGAAAVALASDLDAWFAGSPAPGQLIWRWILTREISLPVDFAGSQGFAGVAAADGPAVFDLWHDDGGSPAPGVIGTITFPTGVRDATFVNVGSPGVVTVLNPGDILEVRAPAGSPADSALADVALRLRGDGAAVRCALVNLTADESVANTTTTAIPWDAAVEDIGGFWSGANPTRLTVPAGVSRVRLIANIDWDSNTAGKRISWIDKNGAPYVGRPLIEQQAVSASSSNTRQNASTGPIAVTPGDYFELKVFQNSGGSRLVRLGNDTWLTIEAVT